ncbi:uncharacterized protein PGTG_12586 [Puccinia graminis f. sp. tritici CRL 75-36-700-3]|uniref:Uncharacterized protein n=1 Tax=Puccinia graminis f. sp. tritici (strain CRL 75-36-700-3 / race SCCL) TaxID=418459 RepID=E3KV39_PUCGT|nr:uncharacterized protein PGTG_12586 [Puccinia graminis f. sp. tritici CRL 75-36-700-3]EFP88139.1 hypothetical protein PGTG_12586 [Puccinia graminis f. sp. tritici CRL 75-36-700-3]
MCQMQHSRLDPKLRDLTTNKPSQLLFLLTLIAQPTQLIPQHSLTTMLQAAKLSLVTRKFLKKVGKEVQYCNAKLMDVERTGKKITKIIPIRTLTFQPLKAWLMHKLWLPGFEALLDSNLKHKNSGSGTMGDVWDGSVWKNLVGPQDSDEIFTSRPGHLVFSLYVDWFNPYGNKSGGKSAPVSPENLGFKPKINVSSSSVWDRIHAGAG